MEMILKKNLGLTSLINFFELRGRASDFLIRLAPSSEKMAARPPGALFGGQIAFFNFRRG
jgi:hypothetical protein